MKRNLPTDNILKGSKALVLLALVATAVFLIAKGSQAETVTGYILLVIAISSAFIFFKEKQPVAAPNASDKRFHSLTENNDGIIALLDEKLHAVFLSSSANRITGWQHAVPGKIALINFTHPADIENLQMVIATAIQNPGKALPLAIRIKHANGYYCWLEGMVTNMLHDKDIGGMVINLRDTSSQKEAAEKITKTSRLYFFISQVNQMIVRVKDEATLFKEACRIAVDIGQFRMAWVGLIDKETKILVPVVHAGEEKNYLSKIRITTVAEVPEGMGPTGKTLRQGKPFFCNDIEKAPEMAPWKEAAIGRGYLSSISVPIKKLGSVVGAFTLYAPVVNFFNKEEIELLEEATSDISFALDIFEKEKMRKTAEEALFNTKQRYQTLAEISPVGIFHTDASGYTTYVNPRWSKISGMPRAEAMGNGWLNAVHEEDKKGVMAAWQEATKIQHVSLSEYRFVHTDGSIAWVLGQAVPERNTENEIVGYVGTITDITESKKAEEQLRKAQEIGKLGYWQLDLSRNMVWASKQAMSIYGFPAAETEIEREKITACIIDLDITKAAFANLVDHNKEYNIEFRINPANGGPVKYISSIAELERNKNGEPVRVIGILQDITERKKAAQEIAKVLKDKETALNRINDGMVSVDNEWRYTFLNDAALVTHPLGRDETLGKVLWDVHPAMKGTMFWDKYHEAMTTRKVVEMESYYAPMDVWFQVKVYPSHDGLTIFYRNITDKIIAQNEMIREKNLSDSIINSLPGIFYLYNRKGKFLRWNKNFEKITKYEPEEIRQMHPLDFFDAAEKDLIAKKIANAFSVGEDSTQADLLVKSKEKIPYYFTGRVIEYEGNNCLAGVGIDFSERTNAQQKIKETTEQLRKLTAHLQGIREEERKRIGREIHDDLGQQLTAIKMDIAWIDKNIPQETVVVKNKLKNVIGLLDGSNQSIRRILSELRPVVLDDRGLLESMEWLGRQLTENKSIAVHFTSNETDIALAEPIATCIFRVYQEALTNIIRHAGPCKVSASLNIKANTVTMYIKDNGQGFDPASVQNNKSFGILGMKERVLSLGGAFEMDALPGKGTKIMINLPVNILQTM